MLLPTESMRICRKCFASLPITEFRTTGRKSHLRRRECNACHAYYERCRHGKDRATREDQRLRRAFERLVSSNADSICRQLVAKLAVDVGGPEALARIWAERVNDRSKPTGSVKAMWAYIRLLASLEQAKDSIFKESLRDASNEELEALRKDLATKR